MPNLTASPHDEDILAALFMLLSAEDFSLFVKFVDRTVDRGVREAAFLLLSKHGKSVVLYALGRMDVFKPVLPPLKPVSAFATRLPALGRVWLN